MEKRKGALRVKEKEGLEKGEKKGVKKEVWGEGRMKIQGGAKLASDLHREGPFHISEGLNWFS